MLGSRKTTFASRSKKPGESEVDGSQSGVGDEDVLVGILCSFLPVLGRGDLLFRPFVSRSSCGLVDAAVRSELRQIDDDQVVERLACPSTLVTTIEATARQRHVDDSGSGEKQPFASMWLPVGRTVGR